MTDRPEPIDQRLIVVGDRVLIEPDEGEHRTEVGLYLPRWAVEKESVQAGRIVACGPGIPLPDPGSMEEEPWKTADSTARHVPMQAQIGDYAIFLRKASVEIKFEGGTYLIVPQGAILLLDRNPPRHRERDVPDEDESEAPGPEDRDEIPPPDSLI
ncbi:MAG TPA: co-chaperone GroES family protein [Gemmatimonadota bacterium]|nr:co-chaperone GroES family protein [Gemmatimonadota bacterium]